MISPELQAAHKRWSALYQAVLDAVDMLASEEDTCDGSREKALARLAPFFAQGVHSGTVVTDCPTRSLPQYRLSDAVREEGYELVVIDASLGLDAVRATADKLNLEHQGEFGLVCVCKRGDDLCIVCPADAWDYVYAAAHEIAEHRNGFAHCESMWDEQCNLMQKWIRRLVER